MPARITLAEKVYQDFQRRLLERTILPGQEFNRRQLARELGVSPAPVAEAMLRLQHEGLVESQARHGTRVRTPTLRDVRGQLLLREAIECEASRWYCGEPARRRRPGLAPLARRIDRTDNLAMENWRDDLRFHRTLIELAGLKELLLAFDRIARLSTFTMLNIIGLNFDAAPRASHVEMLDALAAATPDEAENVIRKHLRTGKGALFAVEPAEPSRKAPAAAASTA